MWENTYVRCQWLTSSSGSRAKFDCQRSRFNFLAQRRPHGIEPNGTYFGCRHPREGGDPKLPDALDSRLRGNDGGGGAPKVSAIRLRAAFRWRVCAAAVWMCHDIETHADGRALVDVTGVSSNAHGSASATDETTGSEFSL